MRPNAPFVWEIGNYVALYTMYNYVNARATLFVFILPLTVMRLGLMVGNWGQHAFVDPADPDSDYLSSITLIDVPVSCPLHFLCLKNFV